MAKTLKHTHENPYKVLHKVIVLDKGLNFGPHVPSTRTSSLKLEKNFFCTRSTSGLYRRRVGTIRQNQLGNPSRSPEYSSADDYQEVHGTSATRILQGCSYVRRFFVVVSRSPRQVPSSLPLQVSSSRNALSTFPHGAEGIPRQPFPWAMTRGYS